MKTFIELLLLEIILNLQNNHTDNYDYERFGVRESAKPSIKSSLKSFIKKILRIKEFPSRIHSYLESLASLSPYIDGFCRLYSILEDDKSKELLVKLIAYRILGKEKIKLPLNTPEYWKGIDEMEKIRDVQDFIRAPFVSGRTINLYHFNLNKINIPIKIYYTSGGIFSNLKIKQYEYITDETIIKPETGDFVLDCGACWGDTALFFAKEVGDKGHIYSFDFIPSNMSVFKKNIELNPNLMNRITLVPLPLSNISEKELYYLESGPGSRVTNEFVPDSNVVKTIAIDDFVEENNISKVDFIKMDIEGAELPALKGGINTMRKFKPKLAISIYHSLDDFVNIPQYLNELNLGYKFFLNHGTIHNEETILLAIAK